MRMNMYCNAAALAVTVASPLCHNIRGTARQQGVQGSSQTSRAPKQMAVASTSPSFAEVRGVSRDTASGERDTRQNAESTQQSVWRGKSEEEELRDTIACQTYEDYVRAAWAELEKGEELYPRLLALRKFIEEKIGENKLPTVPQKSEPKSSTKGGQYVPKICYCKYRNSVAVTLPYSITMRETEQVEDVIKKEFRCGKSRFESPMRLLFFLIDVCRRPGTKVQIKSDFDVSVGILKGYEDTVDKSDFEVFLRAVEGIEELPWRLEETR